MKYYWVVDPALGSVEVFELCAGRYTKAIARTHGVISNIPGCTGLKLDVDALWQEIARLPDA